jgi:hypothetical protein
MVPHDNESIPQVAPLGLVLHTAPHNGISWAPRRVTFNGPTSCQQQLLTTWSQLVAKQFSISASLNQTPQSKTPSIKCGGSNFDKIASCFRLQSETLQEPKLHPQSKTPFNILTKVYPENLLESNCIRRSSQAMNGHQAHLRQLPSSAAHFLYSGHLTCWQKCLCQLSVKAFTNTT